MDGFVSPSPVAPEENIGAWYQLFRGDNTVATEQGQEVKKVSPALGELLINAIKLRKYACLIGDFAASIEQDISSDIAADIADTPALTSSVGSVPPVTPVPVVQPLRFAVDRREMMVKYADELTKLVNAIDGVLARVKFKEQQ